MKSLNKEKFKSENNIPENAILMLFRNPKEFKYFHMEKVNPDHKIIIWGYLKKKYRRTAKIIMAGKLILPILFFINVDIDIIVSNIPAMFYSFILVNIYLFFVKMETLPKCLLGLRAVWGLEKQLS